MVDQIAVVTKTVLTTDEGGNVDFTSGSITETFTGALIILSNQDADDNLIAHGILGYGFIAPEVSTEDMSMLAVVRGNTTTQNTNLTSYSVTSTAFSVVSSSNGSVFEVEGKYDSTISGGVRIAFTTVDFNVKVTVVLFAGLSRASIGTISSDDAASTHEDVGSGTLFRPDVVIILASAGTLGLGQADCAPCLGIVVDTSTVQQKCAYINLDRLADPTDSDGYIRSDACAGAFDGTTRTAKTIAISTFDSTGFNHQASGTTGNANAMYLALKFSGSHRKSAANMSVAASTGEQTFSAFGFAPEFVLGMGTLLASEDSLTDGATVSVASYFVTGSHGSRSYGLYNQEGLDVNPTLGNSGSLQGAHALMLLNHTGTVVQQAAWSRVVDAGFVLNFSTASEVGYMTALGLTLGHPFTESVGISETAILQLALVSTESVPISESTAMQVDEALSETVSIQENVGSYFVTSTTSGDTVSISETSAFLVTEGTMPEGSLMSDGAVFQGTPQAAAVFVLGAAEGLVQQGAVVEGEVFVLAAVEGTVVTQ